MLSTEMYVLLAPFAVWRLTHMVWAEKIMRPVRYLFGERIDKGTGMESYPSNLWGYLINCFLCLSVHISILVTVTLVICPIVILPFALSGLAILIQKVNEKCLS